MNKFILHIVSLLLFNNLHAQLPDFNTYLIANLDNYESYSALWGYTDSNGREYALLGCFAGTAFIDITDSSNVIEVDYVPGVGSNWREIKTYSHYAYVVSEGTTSRLQIIDLQYLPDSVSLVTTWGYSGYSFTHAISQSGPFLYLSGGNASPNGGVQVIDITNPVLPVKRGNNSLRYVHDCRIREDTVWATNINNQKVTILNAANKDSIREIRNFTTIQQMPHNCALTDDRKYIFVTHENMNPGTIDIYDVQNLDNITYVRNWQPTNISTAPVHNVEIYGNLLFAAHYTAGVRILDITNPVDPVEIAWYDTRPQDNSNNYLGCWAVYKFQSGKIIASDITNGLFVFKMTIPTSVNNLTHKPDGFEIYQNYPNPFNPETSIEYNIPENGFVKLSVYDNSGKLIKILDNSFKSRGKHNLKFNASGFSSGIFYCKIEFGGYSDVIRLVMVK